MAGEPVVYYVGPGHDEELRYSLRSLVNLPHERVVIVGDKPAWVTGVEHVPGNGLGSKEANEARNLRLACDHVGGPFVVFNDDFYVLEPVTTIVPRHAGPVSSWQPDKVSPFRSRVRLACRLLEDRGLVDPLVWVRHTPFPVAADELRLTLELAGRPPYPEWKTLYAGMWSLAGEYGPNAKVFGPGGAPRPFLSSDRHSFRYVRPILRAAFPEPSEYESWQN